MNCAVHPESAATAYCRTCGKALCDKCSHNVRGVIYCEDCLASRLQGTTPSAPAATIIPPSAGAAGSPPPPGAAAPAPTYVTSGPSPGLAGVLAGFFPFGVGAVYTGQYAKGLAHMLIFVALVWGASSAGDGYETFFGLAIAFFYVYQIIDSVRSAHALRMGQPAPDPFGLARAFGAGERPSTSMQQVPVGAVVLIGLGVLFLLNTLGLFHFYWIHRLWPVSLIAIGVWLFMKRMARNGAGSAPGQP